MGDEKIVLKGAGVFLIVEGILSIVGSEDKRPVSNLGRFIRIVIGFGLILLLIFC